MNEETIQPFRVESIKEEIANLQMENSKLKAHCNCSRNALHDIINLEVDMLDQASWIASTAIKQTEEQSLKEHDEMVVELFKQQLAKAE